MKIKLSIYNDDEHGRDIQVVTIRPSQNHETIIVQPGDSNNLAAVEIAAGELIVISVPGT